MQIEGITSRIKVAYDNKNATLVNVSTQFVCTILQWAASTVTCC